MLLILTLSLLAASAMAQPGDIKEFITTRMAARNYHFPDSMLQNQEFQKRIIPELEKVNEDILDYPHDIRDSYSWALTDLYRQNPEPEIRGKLAELMLYGCLDQSECCACITCMIWYAWRVRPISTRSAWRCSKPLSFTLPCILRPFSPSGRQTRLRPEWVKF